MVRDGIGELLEYARPAGMPLAIEPLHPMYAADRACVNTLAHANDLCDELGDGYRHRGRCLSRLVGSGSRARDRARRRSRQPPARVSHLRLAGPHHRPVARSRHDGRRRDRLAAHPRLDGSGGVSRVSRGGDLFRQSTGGSATPTRCWRSARRGIAMLPRHREAVHANQPPGALPTCAASRRTPWLVTRWRTSP